MRYSLISPTFKRPDEVSEFIASIAKLSYPREAFEVILGDGTPGDAYEPGMELHGKYVFLSEGVRGSLSKEVIAKFDLSKGHCPQKFGIGMKEIWEIDPEKHREGSVTHTMGWPLGSRVPCRLDCSLGCYWPVG